MLCDVFPCWAIDLGVFKASATRALNKMMRILYHSDVWVQKPFAMDCVKAGWHFAQSYRFLAHISKTKSERKYPMLPKLHAVEEIVKELQVQSQNSFWAYNPLVESCSVDEDFIGRCAFLSRSVSPRATCIRSLQRYLVQILQVWPLDNWYGALAVKEQLYNSWNWTVFLKFIGNILLPNTMVFWLKHQLIMVFLHLKDQICQILQLRPVECKRPFGSVKNRLEVKKKRSTLERVIFQDWMDNYKSRREPGSLIIIIYKHI